jgi:hypothetical protein
LGNVSQFLKDCKRRYLTRGIRTIVESVVNEEHRDNRQPCCGFSCGRERARQARYDDIAGEHSDRRDHEKRSPSKPIYLSGGRNCDDKVEELQETADERLLGN